MDKYKSIDDITAEDSKIRDGLDGLAEVLGGISLVAAENKKLLQSKDPGLIESGLKAAGVLGAGLVGIGASIAKFAAKNSDIATRK